VRFWAGDNQRRRGDRASGGFTLLEIIVTVALIGLLASVLIVGSTRMLSAQPVTPEDVFRKAVSETRKDAVENNLEVRLAFDSKEKVFTASSGSGARTYPVSGAGDPTFDFIPQQKGGSAIMIAGMIIETQKLPFITFYPDGTCSPFRAQFRQNDSVRVIAIDPWTCAPILESDPK
jgi:prepilin-type N-terminal cleavage/methylation domain-containing protein